jgi:urocanate hydratase
VDTLRNPEIYRAYSAFMALAHSLGRPDLSHQLVLCQSLSIAGEAPLIAASIASAGTLCIEPDPSAVRQSIRSGAIDFTVNNLDEALRALKNELRKGLSIAICLEGNPANVMAEMEDRGVQPDLLCISSAPEISALKFAERGARLLDLAQIASTLHEMVEMNWWTVTQPGKWLPMLDDLVAACIPAEDSLRRSWIKRAPRYLGRSLRTKRYLPMSFEETRRCVQAFQDQIRGETWQGIEAYFQPVEEAAAPTSAAPASPSRFP